MKALLDTNVVLEIASKLKFKYESAKLLKINFSLENEVNNILKSIIKNNQIIGSSIVTSEVNSKFNQEFRFVDKEIRNLIIRKIAPGNSIQYSSKFNINLPIDLEQQNDTKIYLSFADATQGDGEGLIITRDHHFPQIKNKFIGRYNHVVIKKPNRNLTNTYDFNESFSNSLAGKILKKICEMRTWFIK